MYLTKTYTKIYNCYLDKIEDHTRETKIIGERRTSGKIFFAQLYSTLMKNLVWDPQISYVGM